MIFFKTCQWYSNLLAYISDYNLSKFLKPTFSKNCTCQGNYCFCVERKHSFHLYSSTIRTVCLKIWCENSINFWYGWFNRIHKGRESLVGQSNDGGEAWTMAHVLERVYFLCVSRENQWQAYYSSCGRFIFVSILLYSVALVCHCCYLIKLT